MGKKVWLAVALGVILLVTVFTVSCSKEAVRTEPVSTTGPEAQKAPAVTAGETGQDEQLLERLRAEAAARKAAEKTFVNENVHFTFDSSALSERARRILTSKADYLRSHPDMLITIEGHCDDRGSNAYNNALGERRTDSVKIFLVDLGIDTDRLNTVSFGEKRPVALGHDEASWARNRRAQFVIN